MVDSLVWLVLEWQDPIMKSLVTVYYIRVCACGVFIVIYLFLEFNTTSPQLDQTCRGWPQGIPNVANCPAEQCQFNSIYRYPGDLCRHFSKYQTHHSPFLYQKSISRSPGIVVSTPIPEEFVLPPEESPKVLIRPAGACQLGGWMQWFFLPVLAWW